MQMPQLSNATRRDIDSVKTSYAAFKQDLRNPVTRTCLLISIAILVSLVVGSLLFEPSELPW